MYRISLFYFVFEGSFPSTSPGGAYIWRGDSERRVFCVTSFGGTYTWRGLFFEFYGVVPRCGRTFLPAFLISLNQFREGPCLLFISIP